MRTALFILLAAFITVGCEDSSSPTAPSGPVSTTNTNQNDTDVDIDINIDNRPDNSDLDPTPDRDTGEPPDSDDPDLPPVLPGEVPNALSFIQQLAATDPSFATACDDGDEGFDFVRAVVEGLHASDARWGYIGKSGDVNDPSKDVITYNLSDTFSNGDTSEVEAFDVVESCGTDEKTASFNQLDAGSHTYVYPFPG